MFCLNRRFKWTYHTYIPISLNIWWCQFFIKIFHQDLRSFLAINRQRVLQAEVIFQHCNSIKWVLCIWRQYINNASSRYKTLLEFESFLKFERFEVLEGAALRPKNMKKHVSGAPDTRPFAFSKTQKLSFGNLRSPNSNPPFSIFSQNFFANFFFGDGKGTK